MRFTASLKWGNCMAEKAMTSTQGSAGERTLRAFLVRRYPRRSINLTDFCVGSCREDSSRVLLTGAEGRIDGLEYPGRQRRGSHTHTGTVHMLVLAVWLCREKSRPETKLRCLYMLLTEHIIE